MAEGFAWIGAIVAGLAAGLIPFFVAQSRRAMSLAWSAIAACLVAGLAGGALLALPVCIVFTIVALRRPEAVEREPLNYWAIAIPASLLLWLGAMGLVWLTLPPQFVTGKITVPLTMIAIVFGGYIASGITWLANRGGRALAEDDLSARISSIGQGEAADRQQEGD